jgi:hypothetical protein
MFACDILYVQIEEFMQHFIFLCSKLGQTFYEIQGSLSIHQPPLIMPAQVMEDFERESRQTGKKHGSENRYHR